MQNSLIISLISNTIIATLKLIGGLIFGLSSLLADGIHTSTDVITNIISIISSKLTKKRKNKKYPLGFGMLEYIFNVGIGLLITLIGVFLLFRSFHISTIIPSLKVLWILAISFILKGISIYLLNKQGNKEQNKVLIMLAEESKADLYSTIMVFFITIFLQWQNQIPLLRYLDNIGGFLISLLIFKTAFVIIKDNLNHLIGINELDKTKYEKTKEIVESFPNVKLENVEFISYGSYYFVDIDILMNENTTLKKVTKIESSIRNRLKLSNMKVKYVNINTMPNEKK
ncbi:MAG: cation diffusion facilitator family transporter [Bacilli bacterium]